MSTMIIVYFIKYGFQFSSLKKKKEKNKEIKIQISK